MHRAQKQIQDVLPRIDMVIEMLDARVPYSSENPMLAELRGKKPCLKVLSKSDLADPLQTAKWEAHFERQTGVRARPITIQQAGTIARLTDVCQKMIPERSQAGKPVRTMIAGVPNVGKSTLINTLAGRKVAKTGNEPAVTQNQQEINVGKGVVLLDTPGILWPRIENEASGYRLAAIAAVKDTALEYADVAHFVGGYLLQHYLGALAERYAIETPPADAVELLEVIGRKRGCLRKGGVVDYDRASKIFITDLRSGALGRITLETPEMVAG
jgi:ribosome biogenesis GTPase A